MKLYVVTRGDYSDYHIEKIFLDKKKAKNYVKYSTDNYYDEAQIEEWETGDEGYEIIKNGYYCIDMTYTFFRDARYKWYYKLSILNVTLTIKKGQERTSFSTICEKDFRITRYIKEDISEEKAVEKAEKIAQDILTCILNQLNQGATLTEVASLYETWFEGNTEDVLNSFIKIEKN